MILGTKARYAVMAMVDLALKGGTEHPVTLADIAMRQEIPLAYLEQIFSKLRRGGLVQSVRGPGGGYKLAYERADIRISDVVSAVDESIKMTRCEAHGTKTGCLNSGKAKCLTHDLWDGLGEQIYSYLHSVTLEDVCLRRLKLNTNVAFLGIQENNALPV